MTIETKTFQEYRNAVAWARTHAREHCYPHQFWRVEQVDRAPAFAVAVRSRSTGALHHYASED